LKKKYFSSHKLPKQQSTIFWSQGILGVNTAMNEGIVYTVGIVNTVGVHCTFTCL
jgi:hypothetical protein